MGFLYFIVLFFPFYKKKIEKQKQKIQQQQKWLPTLVAPAKRARPLSLKSPTSLATSRTPSRPPTPSSACPSVRPNNTTARSSPRPAAFPSSATTARSAAPPKLRNSPA